MLFCGTKTLDYTDYSMLLNNIHIVKMLDNVTILFKAYNNLCNQQHNTDIEI